MTKQEIIDGPRMRLTELAHVILYKTPSTVYDEMEGITSLGKARNVQRIWTNNPPPTNNFFPDYFNRNFARTK